MGDRVLATLRELDLDEVFVSSADPRHERVGAIRIAGPREGEGPLGAIIDALEATRAEIVVVVGCDHPFVLVDDLRCLVAGLTDADLSVAEGDGTHWTLSAWRPDRCLDEVRASYSLGVRAVHDAVSGLVVGRVPIALERLRNVNQRSDLAESHRTVTR